MSSPKSVKSQGNAIHSISIFTPFGNSLTPTQLLAGLCFTHFSYSAFISAKSFISVKKTWVLTTLSRDEPASVRTAERALRQA